MIGKLDKTATPAEYLAACIHVMIDLLNGGQGLTGLIQSTFDPTAKYEPDMAKKSAIVIFISTLHEHPAFSLEHIGDPDDTNFLVYRDLSHAMALEVGDEMAIEKFIGAVQRFHVPGINQLKINRKISDSGAIFYDAFVSESRHATTAQPFGPYADAYASPD